ncbi:MAG: FtsX-like permease family protein [Roseburia sp.]|nr:FtsX-like permease family protein [Roseburia sp.]MCM1277611.1 FtsX-like permease family protein [Robinsoniella sp.]
MKSYLSLIPISARVRKRQNHMIILCIIISVFLVTTIFSVTDMVIRAENSYMQDRHGSWHIQLENISSNVAEEISERSDIAAVGWSESFNFDADQQYYINERDATLYGTDEIYFTRLAHGIEEGSYPQSDNEIVLSSNAKLALHVQLGDSVTLYTPAGNTDFTVSGFGSDDKEYYQGQTYIIAVYMTQPAFAAIMERNGIVTSPVCHVQFQNAAKAFKAISEIQEQYNLSKEDISENTAVMGIVGKSSNKSMHGIYEIVGILFVLVLLAGVLMISGSMNSNVEQRTKFFGMMRCIGASRRQIIRFVRLEALNWCKTAVPVGMILGTIISWGVCALLRYGIGGEFTATPVFALSPVGLICGAVVGIATVLLAAVSPANRAAKVPPMAAVSSNMMKNTSIKRTSKLRLGKVEQTLGIHHAIASKKNWFLMTASFSFSIILLLCFSVGLDFVHELLPALRSWNPDVVLNGYANALVLDQKIFNEISAISGVENIYGTSYMDNIPVISSKERIDHVNLASYSEFLLDSSADSVVEGDITAIYGNTGEVMTINNKDNPLKVGDIVQIEGKDVKITCAVSSGLWPSEYSIICSQETFEWLTGEKNYTMIGIQLDDNADDTTVQQISSLVERDVIFDDMRKENQSNANTYLAVQVVLFSFLALIAMITIFNIINSISMSVTARIKQYGAMRAVGMDGGQLTRMVAAEAFTYAISGLVAGCGIGLFLSRFLHIKLLTRYFGTAWSLPLKLLCIIVVFDIVSAVVAVYAPSKRIRRMAITETINEL